MSFVSTCLFVITGAEYAEGEVEGGCGLTGGVISVWVIALRGEFSFVSSEGCSEEKPSRSADFWLPFLLSREVVHGVRVVAMPVMVGGVLVVVSRGWYTVAELRRFTFNLVLYKSGYAGKTRRNSTTALNVRRAFLIFES